MTPKPSHSAVHLAGIALGWVLCLVLMAGALPAVLAWVVLPSASQSQTGWRVSVHPGRQPGGKALAYLHARETALSLDQENTCLEAWGLWRAPVRGRYYFRLECDDYGVVQVDLDPVVWRKDPTPKVRLDFERDQIPGDHQQLEGWADLEPGLHLVRATLANIMGQGRLSLAVRLPGHADWQPLGGTGLVYLDRGNSGSWLTAGRILSWLGLLGALALLAWRGRQLLRAWNQARTRGSSRSQSIDPARLAPLAARLHSLEILLDHRQETDALFLADQLIQDLSQAATASHIPEPLAVGAARRLKRELASSPGNLGPGEAVLRLASLCGQALDQLRSGPAPSAPSRLVLQVWLWLAAVLVTLVGALMFIR